MLLQLALAGSGTRWPPQSLGMTPPSSRDEVIVFGCPAPQPVISAIDASTTRDSIMHYKWQARVMRVLPHVNLGLPDMAPILLPK